MTYKLHNMHYAYIDAAFFKFHRKYIARSADQIIQNHITQYTFLYLDIRL